jgi:hypothetical protein
MKDKKVPSATKDRREEMNSRQIHKSHHPGQPIFPEIFPARF